MHGGAGLATIFLHMKKIFPKGAFLPPAGAAWKRYKGFSNLSVCSSLPPSIRGITIAGL
jgi:hypothetical protein